MASEAAAARWRRWLGYIEHTRGLDAPVSVWLDAMTEWEQGTEPPPWQPKPALLNAVAPCASSVSGEHDWYVDVGTLAICVKCRAQEFWPGIVRDLQRRLRERGESKAEDAP